MQMATRQKRATGPTGAAKTGLSIRDLRIAVNRGPELVKGVSFDVAPGKVLALVGESGSGKTMIGRSILRLLPDVIAPTAGEILYNGESLVTAPDRRMRDLRGGSIGMVFQEPLVSLNPAMKIGTQMAEGMRLHTDLGEAEIRKRSIDMLRRIRITDPEGCLEAYPHQFSGGMRQRIMLASVMLLKPGLLIADEPTTALDTLSQLEVLETMIELARDQGTSVLLITHNLGLVAKYADDVVVLRQGETVERGSTARILAAPQEDYTRRLLDSVPTLETESARGQDLGEVVLEAEKVELSFGQGRTLLTAKPRKKVLKGVSLAVRKGEIVAVVGGSGSGKTTLGRAMLRLAETEGGRVLFRGQDITGQGDRALRAFRRDCQIVFQDPFSSLNPRMRIGAIVAEALRHDPALTKTQRMDRARQALIDVGLPDHLRRFPHELSGGQRQRVAIARAVVSRPALIVADEPISALDMTIQKQVLELFETLQSQLGFACIFISHDLAAVQQIAQRIVVMHEGEIVEEGSCREVFANPQHDYTRQLIAASPMLARTAGAQEPTGSKGIHA
ncbi:dipeptide ABC transporter ATP-binding protein [Maritimibacter alkaliphilus]|uniref:dipeptide ABC transporter ATP-binding protein n=1 Tax=Maritimibacter alkaliphilus TaxID=404236 RepID=UPI0021BD49DE|nr:dipeptide ABC transporter ATP-binding protein [Maritimibacter alkaliphilus]